MSIQEVKLYKGDIKMILGITKAVSTALTKKVNNKVSCGINICFSTGLPRTRYRTRETLLAGPADYLQGLKNKTHSVILPACDEHAGRQIPKVMHHTYTLNYPHVTTVLITLQRYIIKKH